MCMCGVHVYELLCNVCVIIIVIIYIYVHGAFMCLTVLGVHSLFSQ